MNNDPRILVTGATGNVGREVVAQLLDSGVAVRALTRDPGAARLPEGVEVVRGDLADPDSLRPGLTGVDAVFLIWPLHTAEAAPAVLDLVGGHARRVVLLGTGALADFGFDRQRDLLARSAASWTYLRPSTFAANALWWVPQIRRGDVVRGSHGALGMAVLHERDIAAVAVRALTEDGHDRASYLLTGPRVLSQAEQVRVIGTAIGRPLRWVELDRADAREQLLADGIPLSFVDVLLDGYASMAAQPPAPVTTTVQEVTGRPARTFLEWARDHAADFQPRPAAAR
ncbi:NAD(P)H-binding protein [Goodfellowiella coeruleoviolacea]|uniref:Uncharacterized conserved protein YbjT, contains NAD(P)-binding and DUF2867 domains n=1 Tax=Goodfellowiella coeruleoviolacea TaxID=334858 RepID=A0AAE3KEY0_9PSEU|nr:NAD(P)H-binding protein [Goodfellowiella coeruleoviolacea]MCP2164362.1 Uncharacterized conserved protein YbjT, contains NAD(P)-binding and DUF2867 domains [Goodfellowiella coeruleoviolacea]